MIIVVGFGVLAVVCAFLAVRSDSQIPILGVAAGLIAVFFVFYYRRRCPQCGRRIVYREKLLPGEADRFRMLFAKA